LTEILGLTPEGKVKADIDAGLKQIGAYVFKPVQSGFGKRGIDYYVCWRGRFIGIEAKRPRGSRLTRKQADTLAGIEAAGGLSIVAKSWEDVYARLHMAFDARDGTFSDTKARNSAYGGKPA
jgi:hypothetical protein